MTILILFGVILFFGWTFICYKITKYIVQLLGKLINQNFRINTVAVFVLSLFIAGLSAQFVLFKTSARNYKTAYIEQQKNGFKVTVKGKRVLMAHDPISAILQQTYEDSISFLIPKQYGLIQSNEIKVWQNKYTPTGTIYIDKNKMVITLYYDNEETDPDSWNGKYNLQVR